MSDETSIERGHECEDVDDFTELLRWWFEETDEATVGDVGAFGGKAWVHVSVVGTGCHLNADTRRAGVKGFLDIVAAHGPGMAWWVVANNKGSVNRVAFGPDAATVQYFYLYTDEAQPSAGRL